MPDFCAAKFEGNMAQANVAREPSMEEILASIRKIIESNDTPEDSTDGDVTTPLTASNDEPLSGPARMHLGEANRSYVDAASRVADDRDPEEPLSLASAARVQRPPAVELPQAVVQRVGVEASIPEVGLDQSAKSGTGMAKELAKLESLTPPPRMTPRFDAQGEAPAKSLAQIAAEQKFADVSDEPQAPGDVDEPTEPDAAVADPVDLAQEPTDFEVDVQEPDSMKTGDVAVAKEISNPDETSGDVSGVPDRADIGDEGAAKEDRQPLISAEAGAKVAASFGNLNQAVVNGPVRSFDEIAEEMLRPMLQQWLDDNLPTMVERLVREEIERVARGS